VLKEEANIEDDVLVRAFDNRRVEFVKDMLGAFMKNANDDIETVFLP
jgi:hypothetical protein